RRKSRSRTQRVTMARLAILRSGATASSRSRMSPSAGSVSALAIILSLPPGTKCSERRRFPSAMSGVLLAHHGVAARTHDEIAVLVAGAVLEGHDAPLRARLRLPLVHDFRLRVDGVAGEDRLGELDLVEAEVPDGGAERGLADRDADRDA